MSRSKTPGSQASGDEASKKGETTDGPEAPQKTAALEGFEGKQSSKHRASPIDAESSKKAKNNGYPDVLVDDEGHPTESFCCNENGMLSSVGPESKEPTAEEQDRWMNGPRGHHMFQRGQNANANLNLMSFRNNRDLPVDHNIPPEAFHDACKWARSHIPKANGD